MHVSPALAFFDSCVTEVTGDIQVSPHVGISASFSSKSGYTRNRLSVFI